MPKGTVKWFNAAKGYGFIQPVDGSKDVFVHISAVERAGLQALSEGQEVSFEVIATRGKPAAENLRVVGLPGEDDVPPPPPPSPPPPPRRR